MEVIAIQQLMRCEYLGGGKKVKNNSLQVNQSEAFFTHDKHRNTKQNQATQ